MKAFFEQSRVFVFEWQQQVLEWTVRHVAKACALQQLIDAVVHQLLHCRAPECARFELRVCALGSDFGFFTSAQGVNR